MMDYWSDGVMEYWIGVYRAEFFVVNGGEWRVYSFQFTVVVCGAVMPGTPRLPQEDTGDKPYKNL